MSPINAFGVLALASAALAVPFGHEHQHRHLHHEARQLGTYGESSAPAYGASSSVPTPSYGSSSSVLVPPYPISSSSGAPAGPSGYPYASSGSLGAYRTGFGTGSLSLQPTGWYPSVSAAAVSSAIPTYGSSVTEVVTVYVSPSRAPPDWESATDVHESTTDVQVAALCTPDVTITHKVTQTVTFTATGTPPGSAPAAPAASESHSGGSSESPAAPAYSSPAVQSDLAVPSYPAESSAPAPESQAPAAPSGAAPSSPPPNGHTGSLTSSTSGLTGGKRGLAYNSADLVTPFIGNPNIGFAYNWVSNPAGLASGIPFIPELHNMEEVFTSVWQSDAQSAIANGAEYLFGFNEPDIASQANLSPEAAAAGWKQYMEQFAGQVKLVAPAVSNSGEAGQGLDWLSQFFAACSDCTIDAINLHYYDYTSNDLSLFQQQISTGISQFNLPVFVGEFGLIGSDSEISSALTQTMSWMDSNDSVLGYAYYFLDSGFLLDGTTPSAYGLTYGL